jgi:hypothetical protein
LWHEPWNTSKKRLKIILGDKSPDLFPHDNPMNIGRSKMETYINTGVYDLFVATEVTQPAAPKK